MKRLKNIAILYLLFFLQVQIGWSQNTVECIAGGNWFDPLIWSTQTVPSSEDNVNLGDNTVYLQMDTNGEEIIICRDLNIEQEGNLFIGHSSNTEQWFGINGSLHIDGTLAQGRGKSDESSESFLFPNNTHIKVHVNDATTISGKGYFHPKSLTFVAESETPKVEISHYNMIVDEDLTIESTSQFVLGIGHNTFLKVNQTIAFSGNDVNTNNNLSAFDIEVEGVVITNNINLYTKSTTSPSKLNIKDGGSIFTQSINGENQTIKTLKGGLTLRVGREGLFRLGKNAIAIEELATDANFTLNNYGEIRAHYSTNLESVQEMRTAITPLKPENNPLAYELKDVIGASHIAGWYNFTDKPYLIEGLDAYEDFGSTAFKTSLSAGWKKMEGHYPFNHNWPNFTNMVDIAKYHLMDSVFSSPFIKTHAMWANPNTGNYYKEGPDRNHSIYLSEEKYFYDLTKYLLETYGDLDKRFLLQNWEGDWMLRGGQGDVSWEKDQNEIPVDIDWRVNGMGRMFRARMRGVEKARNEFPDSKAEVLFSIEFNKLFYRNNGEQTTIIEEGIPGVLADVIPQTRLDISSWSAYDGRWLQEMDIFPYGLLNGIRIAEYYTTNNFELEKGIPVQLGEFGMNENEPYIPKQYEREDLVEFYSDICGLSTYTGIQQVYLWNYYCSGEQNMELEKGVQYSLDTLYAAMDGKWIVEPDQSYGTAAAYLRSVFRANEQPTAIDEITLDVLVYPNPTQGTITLEANDLIQTVKVYTLTGQLILETALSMDQTLDVTHLNTGHYILQIFTKSESTSIPLLKN